MKWEDPIVKEIHDNRKKLAEEYHYDVAAIVKYYQDKQKASGREAITRPPRKPDSPPAATLRE